ncbi:MAG: ABC transporter ATP-binding protein [Candidatus Thorarchaeota archaeon]
MGMHPRGGPRRLSGKREKRSRPVRLLLGRMFGYLGPFKRIMAVGAVFSIIGTLVAVFEPLVLTMGIDVVFNAGGTFDALLLLGVLYVVLKVTSWTLRSINTWILAGAQAGFVQRVQSDVYNHLVNADLSYHKSEQSGNVTSRVTTDTVSLTTGVQVIIDFASQILMIVSSLYLLWSASAQLALTSLIVVPGVLFIMILFGTVGQRIMLASQRAYGKVSGQIAEDLSGVHIAKSFNREDEIAADMSELNQKAYHHGMRFMALMSLMQPLVRSIGQFAIAAVLFVGGSLAVGTLPALTIGEVFLGIILIGRFMWPLLGLAMGGTQIQSSLAAMDRISDVIDAKRAIADLPDAEIIADESDGIAFENITFSYVPDTPVLKAVDFRINPGEMVAVVGHTGAGKTTLAALINRFYDPQEGRVLIGNQDLRKVTLESLHDAVSLIPQEPYLFDGTIMENIRYGRPEAIDEEIHDLCRIIGANEFIEVLADDYDTLVLENGKNLSAGQRQMITIARTMLANPRILILDEATSRLDAYSEALVQDAQALLFADRTTVVIAHRLTTIADASRILVFDHGELIEEGSHEELLARGGVFKALYDTYYAHQGVEELTEEVAEVAREEVSRTTKEVDSKEMQMFKRMLKSGAPTPELMKKMAERIPPETLRKMMSDNPDISPEMREKLRKQMHRKPHD